MNEVLAAFINLFVDELSETHSAVDVLTANQVCRPACFEALVVLDFASSAPLRFTILPTSPIGRL